MDAIKIDITQTHIAVDNTLYKEVKLDALRSIPLRDDATVPSLPPENVRTYYMRRVKDFNGKVINYLVEQSEQEVFDKLMQVTNGDIERIRNREYSEGLLAMKFRVLSLPWWRRLFKKF